MFEAYSTLPVTTPVPVFVAQKLFDFDGYNTFVAQKLIEDDGAAEKPNGTSAEEANEIVFTGAVCNIVAGAEVVEVHAETTVKVNIETNIEAHIEVPIETSAGTNIEAEAAETIAEAVAETTAKPKKIRNKANGGEGVTFTHLAPHILLSKDTLSPNERKRLLAEYVTRGRALVLGNDRGKIDSHRRREHNLGQFFTPSDVVRVMAQALGIMNHAAWGDSWTAPTSCSVVDFAGCGNGRMFEYIPDGWRIAGADIDPLAVRAASLIYPNAEIIETNLVNFRFDKGEKHFDLAMINPPFSIRLNSQSAIDLTCAEWGIWGKNTSLNSHLAALEMALRCAKTVAVVLPTTALEGENARGFEKIMDEYGDKYPRINLLFRLDLPKTAFKSEGTEWPCSILIFSSGTIERKHYECATWDGVEASLAEWVGELRKCLDENKDSEYSRSFPKAFRKNLKSAYRDEVSNDRALASFLAIKAKPVSKDSFRDSVTTLNENIGKQPIVRLCLGGRASRIVLKPNNLTARLAIEEARLWHGWMTSDGFLPQNRLDWACDLTRNAGTCSQKINEVAEAIESIGGIEVIVDEQLQKHVKRSDLKTSIELNRHSQWIKVGDEWEKQGEDDIDSVNHPAFEQIASRYSYFSKNANALSSGLAIKKWDRARKQHVDIQYPPIRIYDFSVKDIAKTLGRRSVIYSAKQGLAKTRFSIGAVLASGTTKALWVLESRLVNEFKRELSKIGLLHHFHQIDCASDLKKLKLINVITYSRLWKPVSGRERESKGWGPGTAFAAALAKRRMVVVIDEAHKIKSATSKQGIAARYLCNRAKRVILMTGTAIQSYPRNILGLVNAGWGDGSSMNPYGYRRPVEGNYDVPGNRWKKRNLLMKGVNQFVDEFVDVIWYTSQFAQTGSNGMKSREIPRIKNPDLWKSFVSPKLIRRVPNEPEVRASGVTTPEAKPKYQSVEPDKGHFKYYKLVLDQFAAIWKARLEREKEGSSENSIAHILPELDALRFASTAPHIEHKWAEENALLKNGYRKPTALMLEALRLINEWVAAGDRVIVGSEKPSALEWLANMLLQLPTLIPDSDPIPSILALDANIQKRNAAIDEARDNTDIPVLLISVGKGKEGLNLPEFSRLLTLDFGWVPGDLDQYRHRILRPGQTQDVEIVHLYHEGMIDSYMRQLCDAKSDAIAEVIDGQESTFDYSTWRDYRTFALEMLSKEGYDFATEAIQGGEAAKTVITATAITSKTA